MKTRTKLLHIVFESKMVQRAPHAIVSTVAEYEYIYFFSSPVNFSTPGVSRIGEAGGFYAGFIISFYIIFIVVIILLRVFPNGTSPTMSACLIGYCVFLRRLHRPLDGRSRATLPTGVFPTGVRARTAAAGRRRSAARAPE